MKTLVIIDMQKQFYAANKKLIIKACQREIKRAIKNKEPIIFVEYKFHGRTMRELKDLVKDYKHKHTTIKESNSGAYQIHNAIQKHNLHKNLRICGVNTDACVLDTVEELNGFYCRRNLGWQTAYKITVVADATNAMFYHQYEDAIKHFEKKLKLKVIRKAA